MYIANVVESLLIKKLHLWSTIVELKYQNCLMSCRYMAKLMRFSNLVWSFLFNRWSRTIFISMPVALVAILCVVLQSTYGFDVTPAIVSLSYFSHVITHPNIARGYLELLHCAVHTQKSWRNARMFWKKMECRTNLHQDNRPRYNSIERFQGRP